MQNVRQDFVPYMIASAISFLLMSIPSAVVAAEVWPDSATRETDTPLAPTLHACPLIANDCDICIRPVGSAEVVCSESPQQCTPTRWICLDSLGNSAVQKGRRLVFAQTQAKTLESALIIKPKLIHDRVPQTEVVVGQKDDLGIFSQPRMSANGPSKKKFLDRLNAGDQIR